MRDSSRRAASDWGCAWCRSSSGPTAGRSGSTARPATGAPFVSTYPWRRRKAIVRTTELTDQSQALGGASTGTPDRQAAMLEQQRQTIAELQTPVIQVWDRILALPIVGSLDTARTQDMNEALLQK